MDEKFKYGIQFELVELGESGISFCFHIANEMFAGTFPLYFRDHHLDDHFQKLADTFRGFPSSIKDHREIEFTRYDYYEHTGANIKFRLFCTEDTFLDGQVAVETDLHLRQRLPGSSSVVEESIKMIIYVYPAKIDTFVAGLDKFLNTDAFARKQLPYPFEKFAFTLEATNKRPIYTGRKLCS